ncbi:MAG: hypothetical protein JWQ71_346 [Pedosphaera sp.]|nr:hypothetical protein [Pedosphaera sp.]
MESGSQFKFNATSTLTAARKYARVGLLAAISTINGMTGNGGAPALYD